jgi:hypothetical protein
MRSKEWCRWCGHWVAEHAEDGHCLVCGPGECPEPVTNWPLSVEQVAILVALAAVIAVLAAWAVRWYASR